MAAGEEKRKDFYDVLGLKKECTTSELRNAYKKLALKWHPDRCSASGNSKFVEEAKKKFQAIQEAYSVLSDENKRFTYDVGVYDNDDDDNNGMGDFLNEMATMMNQTKPNENGEESFEELQELFKEMFKGDIEAFGSTSPFENNTSCSTSSSSSYASYCEGSNSNNKRNSCEMNSGNIKVEDSSAFDAHFNSFCFGGTHLSIGFVQNYYFEMCGRNTHKSIIMVDQQQDSRKGKGAGGGGGSRRRNGRKQRVSSGHDVSSNEYSGISA